MNREEIVSAIATADALIAKYKYNKAITYYTDTGPNRRDNYPAQMELMRAGKKHKIRAFVAGNGVGKSLWGSLETYFHLSGRYPIWWDGDRFNHPIEALVGSREAKILRDSIQKILFGGIGDDDIGTGIIAREDMIDDKGHLQYWALPPTSNCIGQIRVKHYTNGVFDGWSNCVFKTYAQGWAEFQGVTLDWAWCDEEADDEKIFAEIFRGLRPRDGRQMGRFLATFTPTSGATTTFFMFVPNGIPPKDGLHQDDPNRYTQMCSWKLGSPDGAPHLTEEYKQSMIASWKVTDPNNIEARMTGLAAMGSGRVYPTFEVVPQQPIPVFWKKAFGMDPGQANFGGCWVAQDPNTNILYIYDEYKTDKHKLYLLHAEAFKHRGEWIWGGIDPHEARKPRDTGETVQSYFESLGLNIVEAIGDPDALRMRIRALFEAGALKVMSNCVQIIQEILTYRFDPKNPNRVLRNQDDHILDALLYCICVFESTAKSYAEHEEEWYQSRHPQQPNNDEDGRSPFCGY